MTDRITADPGRLTAFSAATRRTIAPALDATVDHSVAIRAYQAAPNDLSTRCFVDHGADVEALLTDVATFDELPEAFARALYALDGRMGPALALSADVDAGFDAAVDAALDDPDARAADLRQAAEEGADGQTPVWRLVWNAYDHPTGAYGAVIRLMNIGRWGRATSRLERVEAMSNTSHRDLMHTGLNRAGRRASARRLVAQGRAALPDARAAAEAAEDAMVTGRGPLAGVASRLPPRVVSTARVAGRGLGGLGVAINGWDAYRYAKDGKGWDAGISLAGGAGGVILLVGGGPVTLGIGAVLVIGSIGWEYKEEVADLARWIGGTAADAARWVGDTASDGARWVGDTASDGARWVGDTATDGARWVGDTATDAAGWVDDTATDAAGWVDDTATDAARWVADKGGDVAGTVGDGLGSLADGVGDLAGRARDVPLIGGLVG